MTSFHAVKAGVISGSVAMTTICLLLQLAAVITIAGEYIGTSD